VAKRDTCGRGGGVQAQQQLIFAIKFLVAKFRVFSQWKKAVLFVGTGLVFNQILYKTNTAVTVRIPFDWQFWVPPNRITYLMNTQRQNSKIIYHYTFYFAMFEYLQWELIVQIHK